MKIVEELNRHDVRPAGFADSAFQFEVRTAVYTFTTVVASLNGDESFVATIARNSFAPVLAASLLEFVRTRGAVLQHGEYLRILKGFSNKAYPFDCVLIVGPEAHVVFQSDSSALHLRTLEVVPIHHCEFSGDETPEILQLVRRKFVPTLDWRRTPAARIWMSFHNFATGVRSTGQKPGLATASQLYSQIHQLSKDPKSWVVVENYVGERLRLTADDGRYSVRLEDRGDTLEIEETEIDEWTESFLMGGIDAAASRYAR